MKFIGEKGKNVYTMTVQSGKVQSILVEVKDSWDRKFYQRGPGKIGLFMNEKIYEEAVMAICRKDLISWIGLFDAIWDDNVFGEALLQKIFKKHLYL